LGIQVYNEGTGKKEPFIPVQPGFAKVYMCGPTVYNYIHIGNARTFVFGDTMRRVLALAGYRVTYVQNFTDVDDKMIQRANELGITVAELADRFIDAYAKDISKLNVQPADFHPRATAHIPEIIALIEKLISRGLAYEVDGDVYFRTGAFTSYGQLGGQRPEDREAGARVEVDERKEAAADFALWKSMKPGEPAWDSPWGKGRPGWHIECSAMAGKYLGDTLDFHLGGVDLMFPHHENERAQSEAATGKRFVNYWLHVAFLNLQGEKMSKSLGNVFNVHDLLGRYSGDALRYFLLSAHYRKPLNFSSEAMEGAVSAIARLHAAGRALKHFVQTLPDDPVYEPLPDVLTRLEAYWKRFVDALFDDFNTAAAAGVMFETVREANLLMELEDPPMQAVKNHLTVLTNMADTLGLTLGKNEDEDDEADIEDLVMEREEARRDRNWGEADRLRKVLAERGVVVEDTAQGPRWFKR
jgi:cysteinyl-tRNA synthetase